MPLGHRQASPPQRNHVGPNVQYQSCEKKKMNSMSMLLVTEYHFTMTLEYFSVFMLYQVVIFFASCSTEMEVPKEVYKTI